VHLGRRYRVAGYKGRAKVSLPVVVEPGERLDLVFGVAKEWKPVERTSIRLLGFSCLVSVLLAFAIGWHATPVVRAVIVWMIRTLGIRPPWSTHFYSFVSARPAPALVVTYVWLIFGTVYISILARRFNLRMASVASPYVLMRRSDLGKPMDLFKKPYVDPFE
jgi:hypothetical protein